MVAKPQSFSLHCQNCGGDYQAAGTELPCPYCGPVVLAGSRLPPIPRVADEAEFLCKNRQPQVRADGGCLICDADQGEACRHPARVAAERVTPIDAEPELVIEGNSGRGLSGWTVTMLGARPVDAWGVAVPIISAEDAIGFAIEIGDHFNRLEFLNAWQHGDWNAVRDFLTPDLSAVKPECRA